MNFATTVQAYMNACYPALWVTTNEEERVVAECHSELKKLSTGDTVLTVYEWDCITGLYLKTLDNDVPHVVKDTTEPAKLFVAIQGIIKNKEDTIFILKDFHLQFNKELKKADYVCLLKTLFPVLKNQRGMLLFLSNMTKIPTEIAKDIQVIDYKLPGEAEIKTKLDYILSSVNDARKVKLKIPEDIASQAISAAQGLTLSEIESVFSFGIVKSKAFNTEFVDSVFQEKIQQVKKIAGLQYLPTEISFDNVGGLTELKRWVKMRKNGFSALAREYKLPTPRGVGLSGFAGTGKTLSAKAIAREFGFPLFQLNLGSLFNKYVGETEANFNQVIKIIESIGRCVILVDEIEKYLSESAVSGRSDSGTSSRSFGTFLSWLSDRTNPAFIVFTTNDHTILPDALIRKGRFDDLFWVDLPNAIEREDILNVVINKYGRKIKDFNLPELVDKTFNFTGAEIDNLFADAMYNAFGQNTEISMKHIDMELVNFRPQAVLKPDKVAFLRESVKGQLRLATLKIEEAETKIQISSKQITTCRMQ